MKGNNQLLLCEAQMIDCVQRWLDAVMVQGNVPRVTSVEAKDTYGNKTFTVGMNEAPAKGSP